MPSVSRFLGMVIYFYYNDHNPPHFHVIYAGIEAEISIEHLAQLKGKIPPRVLGLVAEWANYTKKN